MPRLSDISDRFAPTVGTGGTVDICNDVNGLDILEHESVTSLDGTGANPSQTRGYVYAIGGPPGKIKIGKTARDVDRRLQDLQTGSAAKLKIVHVVACDSMGLVERLAHKDLDRYRCGGEWFKVTAPTARAAIERAVARSLKPNPQNTARTIATDARQAIEAFLAAMAEEMDDGPLAFKLWAHSYEKMRTSEGWPPVSEKVLSLAMQAAGCRRREVDRRKQGRGRYVAFELPRRGE